MATATQTPESAAGRRVYFVGASGTGKTSLAAMTEHWTGLPALPSAARSVADRWPGGMPDPLAGGYAYNDFQREVWKAQKRLELDRRAKGEGFVSDRAFDHLAYTALYGTAAGQILYDGGADDYIREVRAAAQVGDAIIFHVRPARAVFDAASAGGDGVRRPFLDWERVNQFDGILRGLLETRCVPHVPVDVASLSDRRRLVLGVLTAARWVDPSHLVSYA